MPIQFATLAKSIATLTDLDPEQGPGEQAGAGHRCAAKHLFGVDAAGITLSDAEGRRPPRGSGMAGHQHTEVARFTPSG
jgi:hypothetical protein